MRFVKLVLLTLVLAGCSGSGSKPADTAAATGEPKVAPDNAANHMPAAAQQAARAGGAPLPGGH